MPAKTKKTSSAEKGSALKSISPERISELAAQAYRELGYRMMTFGDGTVGVLNCPAKTVRLMNAFQALLMDEVDPPPMTDPDLQVQGDW
jgi:hypothetical protein